MKRRSEIVREICILFLLFNIYFLLTCTVFAESALDEAGTGFANGIKDFYYSWLKIAIPIAIVSLATTGFMMFFKDEKGTKQAMKHGLQVIVTVIALTLLPAVLDYSFDLFKGLKWDPSNPSEGAIVQESPEAVNNSRHDDSDQ